MNRPIEKNKLRFYYYFGSISAILFLVILLSVIYSKSLSSEYLTKINQLSSSITSEKKRFLRNAVERTISLIETERELVRNSASFQHLSPEEQDSISIERIGRRIRDIRLIDDGYIWVNRIVKYQGGDNYAIRQIHPNLPDTEGDFLSTKTTDIHGNRPYEVELNGVKKSGEIFFEYYFKKLNTDKIAHKLTFAKLYKPWDWVVATGVYLDDVNQLVQIETEKMQGTLKKQQLYSSAIALIAISISVLILIRFEKQISQLIQDYERDSQKYTDDLLQEKSKTERALDEMRQFVEGVTHDLKSPVITVQTFLGFLQKDLAENRQEDIQKNIDFIASATSKMSRLVTSLRQLTHVGTESESKKTVSLAELVADSLDTLAGVIHQQQVIINIADQQIQLYCDPLQLGRIWQNLTENAIKYMGDQLHPQIDIGAEQHAGETVFFVRDNGKGIAPEHAQRIFGLFCQLDQSYEGSGLGLALVKKIVEHYHGRIWVESEGQGKGCCFYFTLPKAQIH